MLRDIRQPRRRPYVSDIVDRSVETLVEHVRQQRSHFLFIARERAAGPPSVREAIRHEIELCERELATDLARLPGTDAWSAEDLRVLSNLIVTAMVATAEQLMLAGRPTRTPRSRSSRPPAPSSGWCSSAPSTGSLATSQELRRTRTEPNGASGALDRAMVTDFGIAKALSGGSGATLTGAGVAIGTPAFMSPEQAAGEREIDGRSDLYSLGIVTYQMLTGELPFNAPTVAGILMKQITEVAPDVRASGPTCPRIWRSR